MSTDIYDELTFIHTHRHTYTWKIANDCLLKKRKREKVRHTPGKECTWKMAWKRRKLVFHIVSNQNWIENFPFFSSYLKENPYIIVIMSVQVKSIFRRFHTCLVEFCLYSNTMVNVCSCVCIRDMTLLTYYYYIVYTKILIIHSARRYMALMVPLRV